MHPLPGLLQRREGDTYHLLADSAHEHLLAEDRRRVLATELSNLLGRACEIKISIGSGDTETPAQARDRSQQERQLAAESEIRNDPGVKELIERFGATLVDGSIEARDADKR